MSSRKGINLGEEEARGNDRNFHGIAPLYSKFGGEGGKKPRNSIRAARMAKNLTTAGFEPALANKSGPKPDALDHSAK